MYKVVTSENKDISLMHKVPQTFINITQFYLMRNFRLPYNKRMGMRCAINFTNKWNNSQENKHCTVFAQTSQRGLILVE